MSYMYLPGTNSLAEECHFLFSAYKLKFIQYKLSQGALYIYNIYDIISIQLSTYPDFCFPGFSCKVTFGAIDILLTVVAIQSVLVPGFYFLLFKTKLTLQVGKERKVF